MDAGIAFGAPGYTLSLASGIASPLDYETRLVDAQAATDEPPAPYRLSDALLALHARHGAAGTSVLRSFGRTTASPFATLRAPGFAVVDAGLVLQPDPNTSAALTFAEAASLASRHNSLRAVPAFQAIA
jgi:hypothetical protein